MSPTYSEYAPPPPLRSRVICAWTFRGRGGCSGHYTVPPDGAMDLLFDLREGFGTLVGTMSQAHTFRFGSNLDFLGIRFRPGGLTGLSAKALEFVDRQPRLTDALVKGGQLEPLAERLAPLPDSQRLASMWAELQGYLEQVPAPDAILEGVCRVIATRPGQMSVANLVKTSGISERSLERSFRRHIGLTPRRALRVARLGRALSLLARPVRPRLGAVAFQAGYADQPHFNREFRSLMGMAPGVWIHSRSVGTVQDTARPSR